MGRFLLRRALRSGLTLFLFMTAMFFLAQVIMPGDFSSHLIPQVGRHRAEEVAVELGLRLPIWQRYLRWLGGVLSGDLGTPFAQPEYTVAQVVRVSLTTSIVAFVPGTLIAFGLGEWLGKVIAWRRRGLISSAATFATVILYASFPPLLAFLVMVLLERLRVSAAIPSNFWLYTQIKLGTTPEGVALYLTATFAVVTLAVAAAARVAWRVRRFRVPKLLRAVLVVVIWLGGWFYLGLAPVAVPVIRWISVPILAYVLLSFGETMLIMRSSVMDTLHEEYVFAARAKGLPEWAVRDRHAVRNALLPVMSRLLINFPFLLAGFVMIERAVGIRGMGWVLFHAIGYQDVPMVMGSLLVIGVISLLTRLALDVAIAYLDPRVRIHTTTSPGHVTAGIPFWSRVAGAVRSCLSFVRRGPRRREGHGSTRRRSAPVPMRVAERGRARWRGWRAWPASARRRLQTRVPLMWRRFRGAWVVFAQNRLAVFGLALVALFALMAAAPPILRATIWSERVYDPVVGYDTAIAFHPSPPSPRHLLGTDALGRDVLSMLLTATRPTFTVAIIAALTAAVIGTAIGAFSAYYRGTVDGVLSYLSDAFLLVPAPIFMVIVGARFVNMQPAMFGLIYGLLAGTSTVAIVMRSHALTLVTKPFIEASQMAGGGGWHIITTHLVPHMLPLAATQMMLTVIGAVVADGFIAFTGIARPHANWGSMVESAFTFQNVFQTVLPWHQLIAPGAALSLFAAAFYFISRGLHEVAEPRLRGERV